MCGIEYRLKDFLKPPNGHCLIVDASAGLSLGALPGLEDFAAGVRPLLPVVDGLVCSPGQVRRLGDRTRLEAGLLVRLDWSNTLRGPDFVLPVHATKRLPILTAAEAQELGAAGMVSTFLLGYEEEIEAACLRSTVQLALEGKQIGLPLVIEVSTSGPRVSLPGKAIELGASYALEGGADVIVLPNPGRRSLETIAAFVSVPWMVKASSLELAQAELDEALSLGGCGLWLDHTVFAAPALAEMLGRLAARLHAPVTV